MELTWTAQDILMGLGIAALVVVLIILYHVLFIVSDLRKSMRRFERVTGQVEAVIEKPLKMTDTIIAWVTEWLETMADQHGKSKKSKR